MGQQADFRYQHEWREDLHPLDHLVDRHLQHHLLPGLLGCDPGLQGGCQQQPPHGPCRRFADTVRSETGSVSTSNEWGPSTGWFVTLVNIVLSVATLLFVVTTKIPMPVDSEAASGEAL